VHVNIARVLKGNEKIMQKRNKQIFLLGYRLEAATYPTI
jgi:hypothetical protein